MTEAERMSRSLAEVDPEVFDAIHRNEVAASDKAANKADTTGNGGEK